MSSIRPRALAAAAAALLALGLAGCTPGALDPGPQSSSTPSASDAPSPGESEPAESEPGESEPAESEPAPSDPAPSEFEPAPSVPPTTGPVEGDLDIACTTVVTPDQIYAINPELLPTEQPAGGVPAGFQAIADAGGVVCAWQHVTSGDVLLVGVRDAAAGGADGFDANGLASRGGTVGAWSITVASPYFEGADADADALIQTIGANLP